MWSLIKTFRNNFLYYPFFQALIDQQSVDLDEQKLWKKKIVNLLKNTFVGIPAVSPALATTVWNDRPS